MSDEYIAQNLVVRARPMDATGDGRISWVVTHPEHEPFLLSDKQFKILFKELPIMRKGTIITRDETK